LLVISFSLRSLPIPHRLNVNIGNRMNPFQLQTQRKMIMPCLPGAGLRLMQSVDSLSEQTAVNVGENPSAQTERQSLLLKWLRFVELIPWKGFKSQHIGDVRFQ